MITNNVTPGEYRIGTKNIYNLYPTKIREKILSRMHEKKFTEPHKLAVANAWRDLNAFETKLAGPSENQQLQKDKLCKESLDGSLEFLNNFEKKFGDIHPTYDCVVYQTKDHWTAVIDNTEDVLVNLFLPIQIM